MLQDVPTILGGRYRIVERLGRGGMADVYRAEDTVLRRIVAIKVFRGGLEREQHLARFRAEVRTLAALTHPHLVALYDAGGDVTEPWCAMEYVDGGSLAEREGPQIPADVARIGDQIATALEYVHARGIVHRDVKPSNVLLDSSGGAFLSDFGIARLVDGTRMTQSGLMIGTAAFLSPEQVRGRTAGPASDVYALGLVLLEALTARREYPGSPVESAVARLSRAPEIPTELGEDWFALLTEMTAEDAAARPAPQVVSARLRAVLRRGGGRTPLPAPPRAAEDDAESGSFGTPGSSGRAVVAAELAAVAAGALTEKALTEKALTEKAPDQAPVATPADGLPTVPVESSAADAPEDSPADAPTVAVPAGPPVDGPAAPDEGTGGPAPLAPGITRLPPLPPRTLPPLPPRPGGSPVTPAVGLGGAGGDSPRRATLLGWLPPERRRPVTALVAAGALALVVAGIVPFVDGGSTSTGATSSGAPRTTVDSTRRSASPTSPGADTMVAGKDDLGSLEPPSIPSSLPTYGAQQVPRVQVPFTPKATAKAGGTPTKSPTPSLTTSPSPSTSPTASPSTSPPPSTTGVPSSSATAATTSTGSTGSSSGSGSGSGSGATKTSTSS